MDSSPALLLLLRFTEYEVDHGMTLTRARFFSHSVVSLVHSRPARAPFFPSESEPKRGEAKKTLTKETIIHL